MAAQLVQIVYDDNVMNAEERAKHCYPMARIYKNEKLTIYFENAVILEQVLATKAQKIAVCSWLLRSKMRYYIGRPRELTQEVLESDYDVLAMTKNTKDHHSFLAAARWHPGYLEILDKLLKKIGISRPGELKIPIYQNSFSARTEIYKDYIQKYLSPAMDVMTNDEELKILAKTDANYSKLKENPSNPEHLMKHIGLPFYPIAPFLLERLFSIYVHNHRINVTHL